jgi:Ni/Fe-hydrogenase subunit HybB-like protein
VPWGLWKILNMVAGVAISTGGFMVGFLVYVLKLERFRPLMKPAILIAFLGYGCSCLALLFDIGLPHRFWHPFFMWNEHSFLFEVFWCVSLYFTITAIELAPLIFERLRAEKVARVLHGIAFGVVVVGISLSSLHHSSLGSLFLVTPQRLHALWYTPLLPLLFITSAMGAGLMFVVLVRILYARLYDPEPVFGPPFVRRALAAASAGDSRRDGPDAVGRDLPMLMRLASIGAGVLGVYLLLQVWNLAALGSWRGLVAGTWESWLFTVEVLLSAALPILLVALPRTRRSPVALSVAALAATCGLALNRLDVGIFGYFRDAAEIYIPSAVEWALSIGVVAGAALAFLFAVENLPVFDERWRGRNVTPGAFRATFDSFSHVSRAALSNGIERVTVIGVLVIPLAWATMYPPFRRPPSEVIRPAAGVDVLRDTLRIDGDRVGVMTAFPHTDHQERLGADSSCITCHHMSRPGDETTPCSRCHRDMVRPTTIFDHEPHWAAVVESEQLGGLHPLNHSCAVCHGSGQAKTAGNAKPCLECHEADTRWAETYDDTTDLAQATSYLEAMHGVCVPCHKEEALPEREGLGDCATCHRSLRPRDVRLAYGPG